MFPASLTKFPRTANIARFALALLLATLPAAADVAPPPSAMIASVHGQTNSAGIASTSVSLGDWLTVNIQGLTPAQQTFAAKNKSKVVLYLGAIPLNGLCMDGWVDTNTGAGSFRFYLQRTDDNRADWAALLGNGSRSNGKLAVPVSVGLGDDRPLSPGDDTVGTIDFVDWRPWGVGACIILTVVLVIAMWRLATTTNALRDDGPPAPPGKLRTYSLARCQMAFWFVLALPTFVYLWLITGALDTLTSSILVLMGVSASTAVFAHAIGSPSATTPTALTQGFVKDVLTDDEGSISFHHFQMFVWTLVLGIIFLVEVWQNLAMPQFSDTLLGLMGISSGTYLGFMLKDK